MMITLKLESGKEIDLTEQEYKELANLFNMSKEGVGTVNFTPPLELPVSPYGGYEVTSPTIRLLIERSKKINSYTLS